MERRRHPRYRIHQMVELGLMRERFVEARAVNISRNGLLCSSQEPIDPATSVTLMVGMPNSDESYSVSGIVVRCEKMIGFLTDRYDIGVEFMDPPKALVEAVEEYARTQDEVDT